MNETDYCEIVIRYTRKMPSTSLFLLKQDIERIISGFTPKLKVRTESVPFGDKKIEK